MNPVVPLFDRLPEIYRIRDAEQSPPGQLRAYLGAIDAVFAALHADVDQLYDNLFVDTCEDWVVPYLGDLLGTSHLKGEARTLRADVADTIALRRRKGTLGAVERLAADLTGWACRAVELRENLGWSQHLNHQRPDRGGVLRSTPAGVPRGGTIPIRDPAALALLGTPFDQFAYTADVKPAVDDACQINLPNLAIFLWRLAAYQAPLTVPLAKGVSDLGPQPAGRAQFALRFDLDPLDRPVRLFNTSRSARATAGAAAPLIDPDAVPGPMLDTRLTSQSPAGRPEAYVDVTFYDDTAVPHAGFVPGDAGLRLFLPRSLEPLLVPRPPATAWQWSFRGDNLCAWEAGLRRPLASGEIAIDPDIGRLLVGLDTADQARQLMAAEGDAFTAGIYASVTTAAVGPVGAHPISRAVPALADGVELRTVGAFDGGGTLQDVLEGLDAGGADVVIEIRDSLVHHLDLAALPGTGIDDGFSLRLARSLTVRAASGQRPVIVLARPLGFRPVDAAAATIETPVVRLEGLYLAAGWDVAARPRAPLIARAAVARLELIECTLAPGGHALRDGTRAPMVAGLRLDDRYGFRDPADVRAFVPTPDVIVQRSIAGRLEVDPRYRLDLADSIVDAGVGVGDQPKGRFAIGAATDPESATDSASAYGARLDFAGLTCFGPVRVSEVGGYGGVFTGRFEVLDNQHGCVKWSWFAGAGDRLPPNHFCLHAGDARLSFTSERFNDPAYGQIARTADVRIRTLGPGDDAMGAFGFLLEAHKWTNLSVRLREFMPVGVRPLVVPVT